jgi:hypothetical protein
MSLLLPMFLVLGLLLIIIAIPLYLEKIPPNNLYGFRVRKTLGNPKIWYAVNKYSSVWFMAAGLVLMLAALGLALAPGLSVDVYSLACMVIFTVVLAVGMAFSIRYMNSL